MKIPRVPPQITPIWTLPNERFMQVIQAIKSPLVGGKYIHWDNLRSRPAPDGVTHEEWWAALKFHRLGGQRRVPLENKSGERFTYMLVDPIPELIHRIDLGAGGLVQMPEQIVNPETRDQYCVSSLIDEAITSSQLEGATTTRQIAREMIRTGRQPVDRSERMILNNFLAMQRIRALRREPLTKEVVFEIHRIVTDNALDDSTAAGRFRTAAEPVRVESADGIVLHDPPPADTLDERMELMCKFANPAADSQFIHPVLRSIILHFWLSYDHPFVDGNGRTARALFYWSMLHHNYWLTEYISISQIIRKSAVGYGRAFLYTETDENDLTYFILYHLRVIRLAIEELHQYIARKTQQLRSVEATLRGMDVLNHRQRMLISHALRHPGQRYTIESHRLSHNVVYETARSDLLDLREKGLLVGTKVGKAYVFYPAQDLERRLTTRHG
jgi:Fic family protein